MPVIVEPHRTHGLEAHKRAKKSTDEGDERTEVRDRARNDIRDDNHATGGAKPCYPMSDGVGCDVPGPTEQPDEEVFGGQLEIMSALGSDSC